MYKGSIVFSAGCESGVYSDGVRNLEVMVKSLSGGSRPEIQEEGRVMELNFFCLSVLGGRGERQTGRC